MENRARVPVAVVIAMIALAGCAQDHVEGSGGIASSVPPTSTQEVGPPDHIVVDTGVDASSPLVYIADWEINVNDPAVLRDYSSAIVSGRVAAVERSYVSRDTSITTVYSFEVDNVYKGEGIPDVISVHLPGGSVPLGEYITSLDELGLYEMKLGQKNAELLRSVGLDPNQERDPRTMDPATRVTENWGVNPTSEALIAQAQPESWVLYIGVVEGDAYYGAAFDHALSYLKGGLVYSVHPEAEKSPIRESELSRS